MGKALSGELSCPVTGLVLQGMTVFKKFTFSVGSKYLLPGFKVVAKLTYLVAIMGGHENQLFLPRNYFHKRIPR